MQCPGPTQPIHSHPNQPCPNPGSPPSLPYRRALLSVSALGLQSVLAHTFLAWAAHGTPGEALWSPLAASLYTALMYWGSPLVALTVAITLLALLLSSDFLHSAAASVLSSPVLHPLSKLSYCLYLLAEQARLWALLYLVPAGLIPSVLAAAPVAGLLLLTAISLAAAYPCSYLLHTVVEKRF